MPSPAGKHRRKHRPLKNGVEVRWFLKNSKLATRLTAAGLKITSTGRILVTPKMGCPFGDPTKCQGAGGTKVGLPPPFRNLMVDPNK